VLARGDAIGGAQVLFDLHDDFARVVLVLFVQLGSHRHACRHPVLVLIGDCVGGATEALGLNLVFNPLLCLYDRLREFFRAAFFCAESAILLQT